MPRWEKNSLENLGTISPSLSLARTFPKDNLLFLLPCAPLS